MRIKSLKLRNFLSYGKLDFSFHNDNNEDPAIYIITGINKDTSNSEDNSNGSGKSTLVGESVSFNLFGKNLRGSSKKIKLEDAIKFGEGTMINEVQYFIDNGSILNIRREKERDGKNKLSVNIDGEIKSKRTKRLSETDIRDFVGIDPDVYYQTISYYKDNMSLLSMNYNQRLEFFKKLINLSIMDEYYQLCKKQKSVLDNSITKVQINKKAQYDIIEALSSGETKYISVIEESISEIQSKIEELENIPDIDLIQYEDKLDKVRELKENIDNAIIELKNDIKINLNNISKHTQDIKNFTRLKNVNCPTCNQLVSGEYANSIIESSSSILEDLKKINKEKEDEIESLSEKILKIVTKEKKILKDFEKAKSENTIKKINLQNYKKQLKDKQIELEKVRVAVSQEEEKNIYMQKIKELERSEEFLVNKHKINLFWLENFANKSPVRSAIMRKHIGTLSDIFEYYLGKLFRNTIIGKMEIDDEGNIDILLRSGEYEVNYWNLSSGERKRADIALLFALYTYMVNIVHNAPKFIVLDEVFDSLDEDGKLCITEAIVDLYNTFNIDIFVISHVDFPKMVFENIPVKNILVTKEDGSSSANFI